MANDRRANDPTTPSQTSGGINPSAPTQGTEGPSTNLGSGGGAGSMRQGGATPSGVGPTGMNPATGGNNPNASTPGTEGGGNLHFRCADVGHDSCPWETTGHNEDEIRQRVGEHGRQHHGLKEWTNDTWDRVRGAIRRAA